MSETITNSGRNPADAISGHGLAGILQRQGRQAEAESDGFVTSRNGEYCGICTNGKEARLLHFF